ncbi:MAG: thioredoxin family protein [Candidatus Nealsonbacteria bacterium]|nr:thioredoxin family protein [Candidatus Nealsonbacteria bacterium]
MSSLTLTLILQTAVLAGGEKSYTDARSETTETGKPMAVLVSAQWCGPCQKMKKTVIPEIEKRGLLDDVTFAVVYVDRERTLAKKLIGNGAVPQLFMFRKTSTGWQRKKLVGGQTVNTVERFITRGVEADRSEVGS